MNQALYEYIRDGKHHAFRKTFVEDLAHDYADHNMDARDRMADRFVRLAAFEDVHILDGEQIVFLRTVKNLPPVYTDLEWDQIKRERYVHEYGYISNICPDYGRVIGMGLDALRAGADAPGKRVIDAICALSDRYRAEAQRIGRNDIAEVLSHVPRGRARNFREALQFFRILHFSLWLEGNYHLTVGRFDQYMYSYFKADMDAGIYTTESAGELLDDFFLSFNKDSDLYPGVQQGDNGQSMMLGGRLPDGSYGFNTLSSLCLRSSERLHMIDPKINLRVDKNTPPEVFRAGTELTRTGLGFPQYSNDDVVIPALEELGYAHEDAVNYTVAACWEFIIPGKGRDVPNIAALNFPLMVERAMRVLPYAISFSTFYESVRREIFKACDEIVNTRDGVMFIPSPFLDLVMDEPKYHNYGVHGSGIACAADSLAAIKEHVFEKKDISAAKLTQLLAENFENDPELYHLLRYETPKMGQDDDEVDRIATRLLDDFGSALRSKRNSEGGIWRAGTGTAMLYLHHAEKVGATADGRRRGEPFGANFSPNLFAKTPGPVSVIRSFTKQHFENTINGGPLTLEFDSGIFTSRDTVEKVAELVRYFILRGGHQLQLNAVSAEDLKNARLHPEAYRSLVVRVWGWSAYFVELDSEYQDHIMARQEYGN